jgi:hypothetical protein
MIKSQNTICLAVELKFINASDGDITLNCLHLSLSTGSATPMFQFSLMLPSDYGSPDIQK